MNIHIIFKVKSFTVYQVNIHIKIPLFYFLPKLSISFDMLSSNKI